ncbi:MAG: hypothetical protein R3F54_02015 [Alphaproteobacteria bacterium]
MTKSSRKSVRNGTIGLNERPSAEFVQKNDNGALDHESFQSLITTAVLAATAFRLRDQDGLTAALRLLVQAVRPFEVDLAED